MTRLQPQLRRLAPILLLVVIALLVAACSSLGQQPGASGGPTPTHSQAPLVPATPGANPIELMAWLFTPIFQSLFITLVFFHQLFQGNVVVAIFLLTVVLRILVIPLYRRQLVSTRQMQLIQPEVKQIQAKYKGDRVKQQAAVQEYYRQRGINPAGGCLPLLLQFGLLIPMYSVFSSGLTNHDITPMLHVFGFDLASALNISCAAAPVFDAAGHVTNPCLNPFFLGIDWGLPEPVTTHLSIAGFGISILAIISSLVQLVASRQMLAPVDPRMADDANVKVQRQMAYFLPFISLLYGGFLPAGLFLYWIVSSIFQIGQQFLVMGYGGTFPLFGWFPEFARNHTPRYHVTLPQPKPIEPGSGNRAAQRAKTLDRDLSAQSTIRPNRQRSGRRGRRR